MNIDKIQSAINELENDVSTFENCEKLASLYICKDYYSRSLESNGNNNIDKEFNDILPAYHHYIEIKRKYQLGEVPESTLLNSANLMCKELKEFLITLYNCADTVAERRLLQANNLMVD